MPASAKNIHIIPILAKNNRSGELKLRKRFQRAKLLMCYSRCLSNSWMPVRGNTTKTYSRYRMNSFPACIS